jgi:hypothetical protein
MAESTILKFCAVCGIDCADKPRTKDTLGNYFCKPCFDELLVRKQRGERIVLRRGALSGHSAARVDDPLADLAIRDDSPLAALDLGTAASASFPGIAPPPPEAGCPQCGAALRAGARLCVSCGRRVDGVGALRTTVGSATSQRGSSAAPVIFGIGGIIAGGLGVLIGLACLAAALLTLGFSVPLALLLLGFGILHFWLGGLHLLGAVDTLRQNAIGPQRLRLSAGIYFGLTVVGAVAQAKLMSGELRGEVSAGELIGAAVAGVLMVSIWPIAVLVWTSLRSTRELMRGWA